MDKINFYDRIVIENHKKRDKLKTNKFYMHFHKIGFLMYRMTSLILFNAYRNFADHKR